MPLEEAQLLGKLRFEVAARQAGHNLEQNRDVIFRLARRACALDPERFHILTDTRQRALVKKTGDVIGSIRKQVAAT